MHYTKNIVSYTPKFMAQLLLTFVRSNLNKKITFYYQMSP